MLTMSAQPHLSSASRQSVSHRTDEDDVQFARHDHPRPVGVDGPAFVKQLERRIA